MKDTTKQTMGILLISAIIIVLALLAAKSSVGYEAKYNQECAEFLDLEYEYDGFLRIYNPFRITQWTLEGKYINCCYNKVEKTENGYRNINICKPYKELAE